MDDSEALLTELLETFRLEAQDHLEALAALLIALEGEVGPEKRGQLVEGIFRRLHTLKGAAHAVNLGDVARNCQELESLLADLKRGEISLTLELFDRLHGDIDAISRCILAPPAPGVLPGDLETAGPVLSPYSGAREPQGVARKTAHRPKPQEGAADTSRPAERRETPVERSPAVETVRVPTHLLESLLLQAEELVSAKLAASVLVEDLAATASQLTGRGTARARALDLARAALRKAGADLTQTRLAGLVEEFSDSERSLELRLRALEKGAEQNLRALRSMIDPLLDEMKKLHLLPFSTLTEPFSKVVRDLARELGKEAELTFSGGAFEIDRRILDELKEPLLHIIRNVMDHGIEKAPERAEHGKPSRGRIRIDLRLQDGNRAELIVVDDGRGIDPVQVKGTAIRLELITAEASEGLGDAEALQLVFESGFSTSPIITTLSGRGVGLAIVRESLERLGGHVTVASRPGRGCEFRLQIPLSFALIRGLQVETGGRICILPAANVESTARLPREEIRLVENRETVLLGGEVISLVSLGRVLGLGEGGANEHEGCQQVVLLQAADKRIAFAVDQIIGVREVLVKPLGRQLARVRNLAGATVLGDGSVVPILNVNDLFRSAVSNSSRGVLGLQQTARAKPKRLSVLVAEDSITSRTLLKNILESSGFQVTTAIDGFDALTQLKTGSFDIVVSDVEMPRLDGFQLTQAIRQESNWAALPVILVTGLESRADRERGIDVGANAYVVKSSFDQSSLIEVIQKLT